DREPQGVDGEQGSALEHGVRRACEHEDRGEDRPDARGGADRERAAEPRERAPCTSPAPTSRSGQGRRPMNARPKTTRTKPEICSSRNWLRRRLPPTSDAPTPRRTKTAVSPSTKGTLETTTRRAVPGRPSSSALTAETADR